MKKRFSKKANRLLCVLAALMLVITSISIGVVADSTGFSMGAGVQIPSDQAVINVEPTAASSVTLKDGGATKATVQAQFPDGVDGFDSGCGLAITDYAKIKASIEKKYGGTVGELANDSLLAMTIAFSGTKNYKDLSVTVSDTALDQNADIYLFTYGEFVQNGSNSTINGAQMEASLPGWDASKDVIKVGEPLKMVNGAVNFETVIGRGTYVLATFTTPPTKTPDAPANEATGTKYKVVYRHPSEPTNMVVNAKGERIPLMTSEQGKNFADNPNVAIFDGPNTVPTDEKTYAVGEKITVKANTAKITGYKFVGWVPVLKMDYGLLGTDKAKYDILDPKKVDPSLIFSVNDTDEVNDTDTIAVGCMNSSDVYIFQSLWAPVDETESTAGEFTVTYEHPQGIIGTVPQDTTKYTESQEATVLDNTATINNKVFTGWTVKGSTDGKVYKAGEKIAVPKGGLTLVSAWDTTNVPFFLHKNSTVQVENGQTQYPSEFFTPHGSMSGQVSGIAFVTGAGELIKDGKVGGKDNPTEEEVTAAVAKFAGVQTAITVAPNNATMQNVIKVNFGDNVLADYNKGKIDVLWYVVKNGTSDSCPFHVDGVLYNKATGGIVVPASYTYTVEHRYYTQAFGEETDFNNPGRKTTNPVRWDATVGRNIVTGDFIPGELSGPFTVTKSTLNIGPGKGGTTTSDIKLETTRTSLPDGGREGYTTEYKVNYVAVRDTVTVDGKVSAKDSTVCSATTETVNLDPNKTTHIIVYYLHQVDGGRLNYDWNNPTDTNNEPIPVSADFKLPEDPRLYYEPDHVTVLNPSFKEGDKWIRIGEDKNHIQGGGNGETAVLEPKYLAMRDQMIEGYRFIGWIRKYYTQDKRYFSGFQMAPETLNSFKFVNVESRAGQEPTDSDTGETLIAQWVKLNTITYEIGDNAPEYTGTLPTDDKKYETGENATLAKEPGVKDPTNPNNKLIGWIIDNKFYELGGTVEMPNHDVVAKGVWEGDVKYDANFPADSDSKGTAPTDNNSYRVSGEKSTVTVLGQNDMTVTGYEFKGWQLVTGKDENGHDIVKPSDRDDGLWLSTDKVGFDYNYTFKGVWAPKDKVTVTFYAGDYRNDRLVVVSRQSIDPTANKGTGEVINVPNTADVSRNYNYSSGNVNYLFNGTWSKEADGNATEIPKKTTENLSFYARYNTTTIPGVVTSETTAPNTPPPGVITTAPDDQNRESAATTPQNPTQPTRPGTPDETGVGGVSPNEGGPNTLVEDITGNPPAATPVIAPVVNTPATIGNILNSLIGNLPANAVVGTGTIPAALPTALLNEEDIGNNLTPTGGLTPEEDIGSNRIPVAAGSGVASWALLNLLLAIATLAGCVFRVIGYFTNKKHPESDEAYAQASADTAVQFSYGEAKNVDGDRPIEDEKIIRRKALARLFSIVPAVIAIVTFFLTEDVTQPMVLIDKYTLFMMAIAIVQLVVALVFSKKKLKKDDDNKGGMDKGALANA